MTTPRYSLIVLDRTPYYHCISRCVRQAYLCGRHNDGRCFDHRKQWIVDWLARLTKIFAIDIAAYSVMSNHYHVVLHVDQERAMKWDDREVIHRWSSLYKGPDILQRYNAGEKLQPSERIMLRELVQNWRNELCNISRFMATINYAVAVQANKEEGCKGRFWQGRFVSQALKDEAALLACMAYVDLNPVRAKTAPDLASSQYTSIQTRIRRGQHGKSGAPRLMRFNNHVAESEGIACLPCDWQAYLRLVEWQGRQMHPHKRGVITSSPALLVGLGLSENSWWHLSVEIAKETNTMLQGLECLERNAGKPFTSRAA